MEKKDGLCHKSKNYIDNQYFILQQADFKGRFCWNLVTNSQLIDYQQNYLFKYVTTCNKNVTRYRRF